MNSHCPIKETQKTCQLLLLNIVRMDDSTNSVGGTYLSQQFREPQDLSDEDSQTNVDAGNKAQEAS